MTDILTAVTAICSTTSVIGVCVLLAKNKRSETTTEPIEAANITLDSDTKGLV